MPPDWLLFASCFCSRRTPYDEEDRIELTEVGTAPDPIAAGASPEFRRALGLFDSVMIVAGIMVGSGIFIVSAEIMRQVGSAG